MTLLIQHLYSPRHRPDTYARSLHQPGVDRRGNPMELTYHATSPRCKYHYLSVHDSILKYI